MKNEISYDENKETQVWNIYQSLRGEVTYANAFNYKIISILVPAVTIILSLGYKLNNINSQIPIFLSAFFIAYSCSRLMQANRRRIWRITTYMVVFLEPHLTHVNWESDLQKQRRKAEKKGVTNAISSLVGSNEVIIVQLIYVLIAFTVFIQILLNFNGHTVYKVIALIVTVVGTFIVSSITYAAQRPLGRDGKVERSYLEEWIELKKNSIA